MKHKNNWTKLKGDVKQQRIMDKLMAKVSMEKPSVTDKGALWGTKK